ncbi:hypothetical protein ON010_g3303 [Phytophthora cinnamomi]|nr:hypothetical protein ON010_g3303 [Phytophthora cinnamomi]
MAMTTAMEWEAPIPVWIESISIDVDDDMSACDLMASIPTTPTTPVPSKLTHSIIATSTSTTEQQSLFGVLQDLKPIVTDDFDMAINVDSIFVPRQVEANGQTCSTSTHCRHAQARGGPHRPQGGPQGQAARLREGLPPAPEGQTRGRRGRVDTAGAAGPAVARQAPRACWHLVSFAGRCSSHHAPLSTKTSPHREGEGAVAQDQPLSDVADPAASRAIVGKRGSTDVPVASPRSAEDQADHKWPRRLGSLGEGYLKPPRVF